jgi:hypothetical protein
MGNESTDEASSLQKSCAGCAAVPPHVDGDFALIRAGWRLTRPSRPKQEADRKPMWWCPTCFERRRTRTLA